MDARGLIVRDQNMFVVNGFRSSEMCDELNQLVNGGQLSVCVCMLCYQLIVMCVVRGCLVSACGERHIAYTNTAQL